MAQDRATFQRLARERLAEAKVLLAQGHASGAYYLAGYAIECALKARISASFQAGEIPALALVRRVYTHDLLDLLRLAGLEAELKMVAETDPDLQRRWSIIVQWSESARYDIWTRDAAESMLDAVDGNDEGFFRWLTNRW